MLTTAAGECALHWLPPALFADEHWVLLLLLVAPDGMAVRPAQ
jgi:hypothetical protein